MIHAVKTAISLPYELIADFCQRKHIIRMWLFGSILNESFNAKSDVDVLVEFDPAHIPGLDYFTMPDELGELIGRPVDLHTPESLSKYIKGKILQMAEAIYERSAALA